MLRQSGYWRAVGQRGKCAAGESVLPVVGFENALESAFPAETADLTRAFPERYDVDAIQRLCDPNGPCLRNFWTLINYDKERLGRARGRGMWRNSDFRALKDEVDHMIQQVTNQQNLAEALCGVVVDGRVEREVQYEVKVPRRSRRYVVRSGAQGIARRFLEALCPHTQDWDIQACCPTMTTQMVRRLAVKDFLTIRHLPALSSVVENPDAAYAEIGLERAEAKQLHLAVLNGGSVPQELQDNQRLRSVSREGCYLRWVAWSAQESLHQYFDKRDWPEATAYHYFWTGAEDYVLDAWSEFVLQQPTRHLSLHFDGLRVDADRVYQSADFKAESEAFIRERTGYTVRLVQKMHCGFWDIARKASAQVLGVNTPDALRPSRHAIPAALYHLCPLFADATLDDVERESQARGNVCAYRDWHGRNGLWLVPEKGLGDLNPGQYLVHGESHARPYCIGMDVREDGATLFSQNVKFEATRPVLRRAAADALDRRALVVFMCSFSAPAEVEHDSLVPAEETLLELEAGAVSSE